MFYPAPKAVKLTGTGMPQDGVSHWSKALVVSVMVVHAKIIVVYLFLLYYPQLSLFTPIWNDFFCKTYLARYVTGSFQRKDDKQQQKVLKKDLEYFILM